jgi:tRNA (adenine22-N1)-methyltransferase
MVKLSNRLLKIAERVPAGSRLADIGSDHALLPTYLVQQGTVPAAIAGEVNPGPYDAARKQVAEAGLTDLIQVRRGDGLQVLQAGETDTITIAGMGGSLIVSILSANPDKLEGVQTLVLQPNVGEDQVRRWLRGNGWLLVDETILEEDRKIYEIIVAVKDSNALRRMEQLYAEKSKLSCGLVLDTDWLDLFGPYLVHQADPVFVMKWELELGKLARILKTMEQSTLESARVKAEEISSQAAKIKEVLHCLPKDKR